MGTVPPRCMSTQHPDNVQVPFFADHPDLQGDDEIREAYYVYADLGCDEQMWDVEGKEVDAFVVKKLLTRYEPFFRETRLGRDVRLTLRVPNPAVETAEAKTLIETLESIPRHFDASHLVYGDGVAPIFEVILPMAGDADCLNRVYRYYHDFIVGRQSRTLMPGDITVAEWIGAFHPESVNVIPLFEDRDHMLRGDRVTEEYLADKDVESQRVFLARSDPAMNYGLVSAVLLNKIALARLARMARRTGVTIYPMLGIGSAPFRGGLTPRTAEEVAAEYPSVHTFTIQSAFKYDHSSTAAAAAIEKLRTRETAPPQDVDEERCLDVVERYSAEYQRQVGELAELVNAVARYVPGRRTRKLHGGLFGYAREVGGLKLPRAITFTAALYSVGLPPEVLALSALTAEDLALVRETYLGFDRDLRAALRYCDLDSPLLPADTRKAVKRLDLDADVHTEHREATRAMAAMVADGDACEAEECVLRAARVRRFLG
jgi:phosphoenolpyruvate carboxylase